MKFEFEIPDNEFIYDEAQVLDFKNLIIEEAKHELISKFIDTNDFCYLQNDIRSAVVEFVRENKQTIITEVVKQTTEEIMRNKAVLAAMPKKSEMGEISKEWEKYFETIADNAIKKKFKNLMG